MSTLWCKQRLRLSRKKLTKQASLVESNYGLGLREGREEGKLEVAKRLVNNGMSVEEAAAVSGISVELLKH